MYCSKCGSENADEAKFCKDCGQPLKTGDNQHKESEKDTITTTTTKRPRSVLLYALAPIGFFVVMVALWGVVNLFADPDSPSEFVLFFNNVLIPLLFALSFLAIPIGIIFAIFSNSRNYDGTIKCGNCDYRGHGKKGRSVWAQVVVWLCFFFFWPITLIYYLLTHSYVCPKCGSSFVGLRDKSGAYSAPKGNVGPLAIALVVLVVIAIIGILASVVLVSLNSARDKGQDAAVKASLNNLRAQAELYYDDNRDSYDGLCLDRQTKLLLDQTFGDQDIDYVCNDDATSYAMTAPLNEGGFYCIDSSGAADVVDKEITTQTSCPSPLANRTSDYSQTNTLQEDLRAMAEEASVGLPTMIDSETELASVYVTNDDKMSYRYNLVNYSASELDWNEFRNSILPSMNVQYCSHSDFSYFRDNDVPLVWNYYDMYGSFIGSIELSNNDC